MLKKAGAKEVHVRISAPPFLYPCYYGTDVPSNEQLIAADHTTEEIREIIGADSLGYMKIEDLQTMVGDLGDFVKHVLTTTIRSCGKRKKGIYKRRKLEYSKWK